MKVKAGDGLVIPGGVKHDAHNTGTQPLQVVCVYVVEKGKPLRHAGYAKRQFTLIDLFLRLRASACE